ncbi:MAG: protocatechuate 3,4-dioxygenase subunit alpha [Candidatus Protistobacter heckmanni]|nr:protocatechuate 3,4-dioxygenase subunit alpha [Candidatus Protistobacter heckmanni]
MLYATASQTVGPYLHIGLDWLNSGEMAGPDVSGERVTITGVLTDANDKPIPDGMVEFWQANAHGKHNHPDDPQKLPVEEGFLGFARMRTDAEGHFTISAIRPGRVPGADGKTPQAPHITVSVFVRSVLKRLATRIYFGDEAGAQANAEDAVLKLIPAEHHATLIAKPLGGGKFEWNVRIQSGAETVFFEV